MNIGRGSSQNIDTDSELGFVAILSQTVEGVAEETLQRILPNHDNASYYSHSIPGMAMAVRDDNVAIRLTTNKQASVVLLGNATSEEVEFNETLNWAVSAVEEGRYDDLKLLQGVYVLVVVDWEKRTISVVSDLLGIKPFYQATRDGMTIISDRAEAAPRLGGARIDPIGMAGWLYFGYPLANRTMFESVERFVPASVTIFESNSKRQEKYWDPVVADETMGVDDLAGSVYQEFVSSLKRLLSPYKSGTVLLSGGFDSRLCLLSSLRETNLDIDAITVPATQAEGRLASKLVELTGVSCQQVKINRSIWDEFDSMWYRHPDGFVRWRNLSYLCVKRFGKSGPFIDGSNSDVALRSSRSGPAHGRSVGETEAREYVWNVNRKHNVENYFRPAAVAQFEALARLAANEQSDAIGWNSKFCKQWNIQTDERRNIAYNYLQYASIAPSVQPFYDRTLMERRLRYSNEMFTKESYLKMLKRFFPGPGDLPHSDDLPRGKDTNYTHSRTLWKQLPSIMKFIRRHSDLLNLAWLLPSVGEYSLGLKRHMYVLSELMRFVKLEEELKRFEIDLNFKELF